MIKVVLDTNVLVSALIKNGKPRALLREIVRGNIQLVLSRGILEELAEVSADPKIRRYVQEEDEQIPEDTRRHSGDGHLEIEVQGGE